MGEIANIKERIALLLGIKEEGKLVDFEHIFEKVSRDVKFIEKREVSREEIRNNLEALEKEGLIEEVDGKFKPSKSLDEYVKKLIESNEKTLNRSYVLVWKAKHYYPIVGRLMLPYLKDRAVSVVKIFSGKSNPIEEIDPIFVRYAKYKPRPQYISIDSLDKLMELVHDHCIDFIPYVHKLNEDKPDLFVLDLDAGKEILAKNKGFEFLKYITLKLYEILDEIYIKPMIKFSGSRGFQIWAKLDNSRFKGDVFAEYRKVAVKLQEKLELELKRNQEEIKKNFPEFKELKQYTTSQVAHKEEREDKVLIDWSAMKLQGDVRAPFSMHYKTGLISLPLRKEELEEFDVKMAEPFKVIEEIKRGKEFPTLEISDPSNLLEKLFNA